MPQNLSDVAENRALDWINVVGTPTRPTSPLQVALYTTAPNQETGAGGVEVGAGLGYARQNVTFGAAASGSASNTAALTFGAATASWGTVVAAAVLDSAGTPVMLWSGNLPTSKAIDTGDTLTFAIGQITVSAN